MLSELAFPHIRCCLSAIPSDLMKSTAIDESLSSMNQQFCSRENQLLQNTFLVSGSSKCKVLSVLDLKDAFHYLRLSEDSKKYCGILPYFESASYLYQRMPMGLNISPSIWKSYINMILDCIQSKNYCEAIMDDLLLFTPSKRSHIAKLEDLLQALLKNGLKISPKKCQLFRTNFQYMGNEIFIQIKKFV